MAEGQNEGKKLILLENLKRQFKEKAGGLTREQVNLEHISRLHDYNDIKDIGQMLLGLCADKEGVTTRKMYERFDLEIED